MALQVEQLWSGCKNPNLLDRFTLAIPYCLDYIRCECSSFDCMFVSVFRVLWLNSVCMCSCIVIVYVERDLNWIVPIVEIRGCYIQCYVSVGGS